VSTEDIRRVAIPALRHRILTNFNAEAEGITSDKVIQDLVKFVPRQESENLADPRLPAVTGAAVPAGAK
jgi:MoxR-like ATPase